MDKFCLFMLSTWLLSGSILLAYLWHDVYAPRQRLTKAFPPHSQDLADRATTQAEQWQQWDQEPPEGEINEVPLMPLLESPIAPADDLECQWVQIGHSHAISDVSFAIAAIAEKYWDSKPVTIAFKELISELKKLRDSGVQNDLDQPEAKRLLSEAVARKAREGQHENF